MATLQLTSNIQTNTKTIVESKLLTLAEAMHIPQKDPITGKVYTNAERQDLLFAEIFGPLERAMQNYKRRQAGQPDLSDIFQD